MNFIDFRRARIRAHPEIQRRLRGAGGDLKGVSFDVRRSRGKRPNTEPVEKRKSEEVTRTLLAELNGCEEEGMSNSVARKPRFVGEIVMNAEKIINFERLVTPGPARPRCGAQRTEQWATPHRAIERRRRSMAWRGVAYYPVSAMFTPRTSTSAWHIELRFSMRWGRFDFDRVPEITANWASPCGYCLQPVFTACVASMFLGLWKCRVQRQVASQSHWTGTGVMLCVRKMLLRRSANRYINCSDLRQQSEGWS